MEYVLVAELKKEMIEMNKNYRIIVDGFYETSVGAKNKEEALKRYFESIKDDIEVIEY